MATGGTGSLRFRFLCGIRGYHQYRSMWVPTVNEMLRVEPEISNPHDMYAIATKNFQDSLLIQWLDIYPERFPGSPISLSFMVEECPVGLLMPTIGDLLWYKEDWRFQQK